MSQDLAGKTNIQNPAAHVPASAKNRAAWSLSDQVVSSASNFLLLLTVIRTSNLSVVGIFSLAYMAFFLVLVSVRGIAMEPLLVRYAFAPVESWRAATSSAVGSAFLLSVGIGLATAICGLVAGGEGGAVFVVLAASLPGLLVQDSWRSAFFAHGEPKSACWNDVSLLALQAMAFALLFHLHHLTITFVIGAWGLAALGSALVGIFQAGLLPRPDQCLSWFRSHRDIGPAFAADYIANRGAEQLALLMIGTIGGLGTLGAITTARSLFAPITTVHSGLNSFAIPEAARLNKLRRDVELRRLSWGFGALMAVAMILGGLILTLVSPRAGADLFRGNWLAARHLLIPMTVFSAINALGYGLWIGLRAIQVARGTLYIRGAFGIASIVGAGLGAKGAGGSGALWALTAASGGMAIGMAILLSVSLNRRGCGRGEPDSTLRVSYLVRMRMRMRMRLKPSSIVMRTRGECFRLSVLVLCAVGVGAGAARRPLITCVVVGSAVLVTLMAAHLRRAVIAMIAIAALPLFADVNNRTLTLAYLFSSGGASADAGQAIQLSFVIVAVLIVLVAVSRRESMREGQLLGGTAIGALLFCFSASIVLGELSGAGRLGLVYYAQTIVPLLAWYICAHARVSPRSVARCVTIAVLFTLLLVLGIGLTEAAGMHGNYLIVDRLDSVIPQYRNYFPFLLVCALAFAVARWSVDRLLGTLTIAGTLALLPFMWSRTGIAMLVVAAAVAYLARPGSVSRGSRIVVACIGSGGALLVASQAASGGVIGERNAIGSTAAASGGERVQLGAEALMRLLHHPLFGDSFVPYSSVLAGGQQAQFAKLFPAHNQYLDYGLRGGFFAMVLLIVLLVIYIRRSWQLSQHASDAETATYHGAMVAILVAVAVGNLSQLFVIQTWTGTVLFSLMGVCAASSARAGTFGSGRPDVLNRKGAASGKGRGARCAGDTTTSACR